MQVTNKTRTSKFVKFLDINDIAFLPLDKDVCSEIGIAFDDLLRMCFVIKLTDGKLLIESIPTREQLSINPTNEVRSNGS